MRSIYLQAICFWLVYSIFGKLIFVNGFLNQNALVAYSVGSLYSMLFGVVFLFLFSHKDFFKFASIIEKKESRKEKIWLDRLKHLGKSLSVFIVGVIGGPVFAALSARFVYNNQVVYKYLLIAIISFTHAVLWLFLLRNSLLPFRNSFFV